MPLHLSHTTVDARDPQRLARFCSDLTGWMHQIGDDGPDEVDLIDDNGFTTLFFLVPEPKTVKNRFHFDLCPVDSTRDLEVERAVELVARVIDDRRAREGWVVLAEPEGNEFCILNN